MKPGSEVSNVRNKPHSVCDMSYVKVRHSPFMPCKYLNLRRMDANIMIFMVKKKKL